MKLFVQILGGVGVGFFVPALLLMFISKFSYMALPLASAATGVFLMGTGYLVAKKFKVDISFDSEQ